MNDLNKKAVALVRNGMTYGQAAEELGISRGRVSGACYRADLKIGVRENSKQRPIDANKLSEQEIRKRIQVIRNSLSLTDAARQLSLSYDGVYYFCKKYAPDLVKTYIQRSA